MILVIDNYDSFTYNLVQVIGTLGKDVQVYRNDAITTNEIKSKKPSHIIISPGPETPKEAGISNKVIKKFAGKIPILGVCLGHQCLVAVFGGKIIRAGRLMHGKTSKVYHDGKTIYKNLPNPFAAARYHSLIAEPKSLPNCLEITARTEMTKGNKPETEIMGVRHKKIPALEGVQFHPESFMTPDGLLLLKNFLGFKI
ncbi:MAG: aminodeoxychorismate/anthranilate synthase component II [Planctomycetes bacterium]|nr:aminodeoxychorismate/anthranilate synthase component II [Planctomycetota bacterium]